MRSQVIFMILASIQILPVLVRSDDCEIEYGYRRPGNDLNNGNKNNKDSAEECCEDCKDTEGCVAWTLTPKKKCWLKHTIGEKRSQCGYKTGTVTRPPCEIEEDHRRPGNDLNNGNQNIKASAEECCEDCKHTDRCVAWTLTPQNACWLKHTIIDAQADDGYQTGTISRPNCEIEENYRRPGNDLNNGNKNKKKNAKKCCAHCKRTEGCVAWTFTPQKKCWLKHTVGDKVAEDGYKTGTV
ncbi:uncharacterized protein [Ptychodera flava]|uniref:uncharacterized protein n=1 Tax=Ptychodera flava TaxID=63121 RepID=UPI00396A5F14